METLQLEDGVYVIQGSQESFYSNVKHGVNYLKAGNFIKKL